MEQINIRATEKSPEVFFDAQSRKFEIVGNSRPENVRDFYMPVLEKLRRSFEGFVSQERDVKGFSGDPFKFIFKLDYFNSSSAKFISDMLLLIGNYNKKGLPVRIYWYYQEGDDDMMEVGEDFSEMIEVPFQMIMMKSGSNESDRD